MDLRIGLWTLAFGLWLSVFGVFAKIEDQRPKTKGQVLFQQTRQPMHDVQRELFVINAGVIHSNGFILRRIPEKGRQHISLGKYNNFSSTKLNRQTLRSAGSGRGRSRLPIIIPFNVTGGVGKFQKGKRILATFHRLATENNHAPDLFGWITSTGYWMIQELMIVARVNNQACPILFGAIGRVLSNATFHLNAKLFRERRCRLSKRTRMGNQKQST